MKQLIEGLVAMAAFLVVLMCGVLLGQWGMTLSGRQASMEARLDSMGDWQEKSNELLWGGK